MTVGLNSSDVWILAAGAVALVVAAVGTWRGSRSPAWLRFLWMAVAVTIVTFVLLVYGLGERAVIPPGCGFPCDPLLDRPFEARVAVFLVGASLTLALLVAAAVMRLRGRRRG